VIRADRKEQPGLAARGRNLQAPPDLPTLPDVTATTTEVALSEQLAVGLDRLLRVSSIHAPSHPVIARMAAPVTASLQSLGALDGGVVLRIDDSGIELAGTTFPASHPAAARLRELLERGGVEGVEIAVDATSDALCELGRALRARSGALDPSREHGQLVLPPSLRILESRYGAARPSDSRRDVSRLLEEIFQGAFSKRGAADSTPGECIARPGREALAMARDTVAQVLDRMEADTASAAFEEQRAAIVRILSRMVRSAFSARNRISRGSLTVTRLFADMRDVLRSTSGDETASDLVECAISAAERVLLPLAAGRLSAGPVEEPRFAANPEGPAMESVARELERTLAAAAELDPEQLDCSAEHFSIALLVLGDSAPAGREQAVDRELLRAFAAVPEAERTVVLAEFVAASAGQHDPAPADRVLGRIARELRAQDPASFAATLSALVDALGPEGRAWLWPHVASELLLGLPPEARVVEEKLFAQFLALGSDELVRGSKRLLRMPCARGRPLPRVPRLVLEPPRVELYALYELVLALPESSGMDKLLIEAFRQHSSGSPVALAVAAVQPFDARARSLLKMLLQTRSGDLERRRELAAAAVQFLVDALSRVAPAQRGEPWVAAAVRALAALPGPASAEMLRRVRDERRWLVVPTWPAACRRHARSSR
jgi:hypothetical protein